ncbi:MAG: hypothetical protein E7176_04105 [Erysipelotrichaceae bacterium]|nr:hypothetical protein [Erysipelotrichaceae bacterium]
MVVYNKTELNKEEVFASLVRQTRRQQLSKFILSAIVLICGLILTIYGSLNEDSNYAGVGYALLAFGMMYLVLAIITIIKAPKNVSKQNEEILNDAMIYDYTFKEHSFQVNITTGGKITKLPYKYENIKKLYEYENRYELKLTDNLILFIYKNGFTAERAEEFFKKNLSINKKKIINKINE